MQKLTEYYDNDQIEELLAEALAMCMKKRDVDLDDIFEILDDTQDATIVNVLIDVLIANLDDMDEALIQIHYKKQPKAIKEYIIMALANGNRSKHMQFLIDEYFYNTTMRPAIRTHAFKQKVPLFVNLARYIESATLTPQMVETAQDILKTIPKDAIIPYLNIFTGTTILDIYYAIPNDQRN
jgi:hypothetical protein